MAKAARLPVVALEWLGADGVPTSGDYRSAFQSAVPQDDRRDAEAWAREMYEAAPPVQRWFVWWGWKILTAQLGPFPSKDHILGYEIRDRRRELVRFSVTWKIGLSCDLILYLENSRATLVSLVRLQNRIARAAWRIATPIHEYLVPRWLDRAAHPVAIEPGASGSRT